MLRQHVMPKDIDASRHSSNRTAQTSLNYYCYNRYNLPASDCRELARALLLEWSIPGQERLTEDVPDETKEVSQDKAPPKKDQKADSHGHRHESLDRDRSTDQRRRGSWAAPNRVDFRERLAGFGAVHALGERRMRRDFGKGEFFPPVLPLTRKLAMN